MNPVVQGVAPLVCFLLSTSFVVNAQFHFPSRGGQFFNSSDSGVGSQYRYLQCPAGKVIQIFWVGQRTCSSVSTTGGPPLGIFPPPRKCRCRRELPVRHPVVKRVMVDCSGRRNCTVRWISAELTTLSTCPYQVGRYRQLAIDYFCPPGNRMKTICDSFTTTLSNDGGESFANSEAYVTSVNYLGKDESHLKNHTHCKCQVTVPPHSEVEIWGLDIHLGNVRDGGQCDTSQQVTLETKHDKRILNCTDMLDGSIFNYTSPAYQEVNITFRIGEHSILPTTTPGAVVNHRTPEQARVWLQVLGYRKWQHQWHLQSPITIRCGPVNLWNTASTLNPLPSTVGKSSPSPTTMEAKTSTTMEAMTSTTTMEAKTSTTMEAKKSTTTMEAKTSTKTASTKTAPSATHTVVATTTKSTRQKTMLPTEKPSSTKEAVTVTTPESSTDNLDQVFVAHQKGGLKSTVTGLSVGIGTLVIILVAIGLFFVIMKLRGKFRRPPDAEFDNLQPTVNWSVSDPNAIVYPVHEQNPYEVFGAVGYAQPENEKKVPVIDDLPPIYDNPTITSNHYEHLQLNNDCRGAVGLSNEGFTPLEDEKRPLADYTRLAVQRDNADYTTITVQEKGSITDGNPQIFMPSAQVWTPNMGYPPPAYSPPHSPKNVRQEHDTCPPYNTKDQSDA